MKVLFVSDSHGLTAELEKLVEKHQEDVDLFIHCGDSELDPDHPALKNYVVVSGNCDFDDRFSEDIVKKIGNQTIFITHGHKYSVKSDLMRLAYKARETSADIACFGHSHVLGAEMVQGILFINPGSIKLPRGRTEKTYVIVEIIEEGYELHVFDLYSGELKELAQHFSLPI
jgi:putative phosphoesterase